MKVYEETDLLVEIVFILIEMMFHMYIQLSKAHQTISLKWPHFSTCKLYLNRIRFKKIRDGRNKEIRENHVVPNISTEASWWMTVSLTILGGNAGTDLV